jgi:hypothetical protein
VPFGVPFIMLLTVLQGVAFTVKSATRGPVWLCHFFAPKYPTRMEGVSILSRLKFDTRLNKGDLVVRNVTFSMMVASRFAFASYNRKTRG